MWSEKYGFSSDMSAASWLKSERRRRALRMLPWLAGVGATVIGFLLVRAVLAPDPGILDGPPPEILGTWVTDDPRYADRAFGIREDEFHLQIAPGQILVNQVKTIRRTVRPEYDVYEITYFTPEGESVQEMRLYPDGIMRLKNPSDIVWVRR